MGQITCHFLDSGAKHQRLADIGPWIQDLIPLQNHGIALSKPDYSMIIDPTRRAINAGNNLLRLVKDIIPDFNILNRSNDNPRPVSLLHGIPLDQNMAAGARR